jgi:hypothetical protein
MVCPNICLGLYTITQASGSHYIAGGKYCSTCVCYIFTQQMFCKYCGMQLRASPARGEYKEKGRAKKNCSYFHSQVLEEQFPVSSTSYSNTPTMLLRNDMFPPSDAEGVRKNNEPRKLTFPGPVNLPTPCPVQDAAP